jgi:hypothetical protein
MIHEIDRRLPVLGDRPKASTMGTKASVVKLNRANLRATFLTSKLRLTRREITFPHVESLEWLISRTKRFHLTVPSQIEERSFLRKPPTRSECLDHIAGLRLDRLLDNCARNFEKESAHFVSHFEKRVGLIDEIRPDEFSAKSLRCISRC